jgi:MFS family permease
MTNPDTTPDPPLPLPLPQHAWRHAKAKVEHAVADTPKDSARQRLVLGICVAVGFTTLLDQTIFALAVPRIQEALHATSAQLQLIVSIYSMMFGVALVPAGRLGDMIGRRPLLLLGLAIFSGCSMLGGMATNATVVIVARLFQGLGAGMLNTQVLGLIQDQFQGARRAWALGRYASAGGLSAAVGPILGGLVIAWTPHASGWRWLFLVNVPFGAVAFGLALRHLPRGVISRKRSSLDAIGLALLTVTTLALMGATLVEPGETFHIRASLAVACIGLVSFGLWERRYARSGRAPILSRDLTRSPGYVLGAIVAMCQFASGLTSGMVATLYFLEGLGTGPALFALLTIPGALGMMVVSTRSWHYLQRYGRGGITCAIASHAVLTAMQGAAMLMLPRGVVLLAYPLIGLLQGAASGLSHAPNQTLSLAAAQTEGRGVAAGFYQLSQRLASAVSISWGSGLFLGGATAGAALVDYRDGFAAALGLILALSTMALLASIADTLRRRRNRKPD